MIAGIGDAHLHDERVRIELAQRCDLRLATEPPQAAVRRPVGATRNAVAVEVERIRERQDLRVGHRVEQSEPEEIGRGAMAGVGGGRGNRLRCDVQDVAEGGRELLLNHRTAERRKIVARHSRAVKRRGVKLDVLAAFRWIVVAAATDDRLLVAGCAADRVEQRAEPGLRREYCRKDDAAGVEPAEERRIELRQRGAERCGNNYESGRACSGRRGRGRVLLAGHDTDECRDEQCAAVCETHAAPLGNGTEGAGQHGPTRRHARVIWGLFGNLLRVTICAACSVVLDFFYFIEYLSAS